MELGGIGIGIDKMELTPCLVPNGTPLRKLSLLVHHRMARQD